MGTGNVSRTEAGGEGDGPVGKRGLKSTSAGGLGYGSVGLVGGGAGHWLGRGMGNRVKSCTG